MASSRTDLRIYLEIGERRTFAVAVDWPGWARAGKTPDEAIDALLAYGDRYRKAIGAAAKGLEIPDDSEYVEVVERLTGNATTDFGAPGVIADLDSRKTADKELEAMIDLLKISWRAFDRAADKATGHKLGPSGPRGGGRALEKIVEHVRGAQAGYAGAVGGKARESDPWSAIQSVFIDALRARNAGELPDRGPRGGVRWPATFAIRRSAWHALDHAWEIEDRTLR
jgi:hypothetical protein